MTNDRRGALRSSSLISPFPRDALVLRRYNLTIVRDIKGNDAFTAIGNQSHLEGKEKEDEKVDGEAGSTTVNQVGSYIFLTIGVAGMATVGVSPGWPVRSVIVTSYPGRGVCSDVRCLTNQFMGQTRFGVVLG